MIVAWGLDVCGSCVIWFVGRERRVKTMAVKGRFVQISDILLDRFIVRCMHVLAW